MIRPPLIEFFFNVFLPVKTTHLYIEFFRHHLESILHCFGVYSLLTWPLFAAWEDFLLYARNMQAPMTRTRSIPNIIDISIATSCGGTGGGGGEVDGCKGGRGGDVHSGMVGRGSRADGRISATIAWIACIFTAFCTSFKVLSFSWLIYFSLPLRAAFCVSGFFETFSRVLLILI